MAQIPAAFQRTERGQLPLPLKLDGALEWKFGRRGLLLYGPSGLGKSRIAWEVAKREILSGKSFRHVNAFELARYPSLFMAAADAATKFSEALVVADLLLLDDVFKAKPTERIEELLFSTIDERSERELPCIITLNDSPDTLLARLSGDRGAALIRRLKEFCDRIAFI